MHNTFLIDIFVYELIFSFVYVRKDIYLADNLDNQWIKQHIHFDYEFQWCNIRCHFLMRMSLYIANTCLLLF